jgi:hypothetical protein
VRDQARYDRMSDDRFSGRGGFGAGRMGGFRR